MDLEPLEIRKLEAKGPNGVSTSYPALHARWCISRTWVRFAPPGSPDNSVWLERTGYIVEDLKCLLSLEHHQFWSQMIHDQSLQSHLEHILQSLPRPYEGSEYSQQIRSRLQEISRNLFLVYVRLATHKESKKDFLSPSAFGKIIYDNYLFDIPRLMDLCALFRSCSPNLLEKMVENVFKCQPAYKDDLRQAVESIRNTLDSAVERVDTMSNSTQKDLSELKDLVNYSVDVTSTLEAFLLTYPTGGQVFKTSGFEVNLAHFYQSVVVTLCRYLIRKKNSKLVSDEEFTTLFAKLQLSRKASVSILRQLLHACMQPVLEDASLSTTCSEDYLEIMTNVLAEGCLVLDYAKLHSIQEDVDIFIQSGANMDSTRIQYILDGVRAIGEEMQDNILKVETKSFEKEGLQEERHKKIENKVKQEQVTKLEQESNKISEVEKLSLISQVRDLLPDLGEGFVDACLDYFDNSSEKVINAIFEENLPPHLIEMDRNTPRRIKKVEPVTAVVAKRFNVHDNDEFDINATDVIDVSKVHRGKKNKSNAKSAEELLQDKTHLSGLKDTYSALGIVTEEVMLGYDAEYDDEYDDTYDDTAVGQEEPDAKDDLTERRPFVLPRALGGGHIRHEKRQESESEEEEDEDQKKINNFARNPEEIRAEAERRRQTKEANRSKGHRNPPPVRDVVGKAKGQGQEKNVLLNRSRKNANKGKSHRINADKKQSKGMF